jgi:hypothetical protein
VKKYKNMKQLSKAQKKPQKKKDVYPSARCREHHGEREKKKWTTCYGYFSKG